MARKKDLSGGRNGQPGGSQVLEPTNGHAEVDDGLSFLDDPVQPDPAAETVEAVEPTPPPDDSDVPSVPLALTFDVVQINERGYRARHVNLQLTPRQSLGLRALLDSLDASLARTQSGRRVVNGNDAVRLLLEEAADHYERCGG